MTPHEITTMPRLSTSLLASLLPLLVASACARPGATTNAASQTSSVAAAASDDRFSVYDLGATWRDQLGHSRTLASLRGRPQLVAMIYTHCATTCPLTVAAMKRVERAADDADVGFVLVSLDPARDDVRRLAGYAAERGLDPARWTLLTGSDADVRDLAATLGVRYRQVTPGDLAHSNLITLLDSEGRIARQTSGQFDDAGISALHALAR